MTDASFAECCGKSWDDARSLGPLHAGNQGGIWMKQGGSHRLSSEACQSGRQRWMLKISHDQKDLLNTLGITILHATIYDYTVLHSST